MRMRSLCGLLLLLLLAFVQFGRGQDYKIYCVGNCGNDIIVPTEAGTVLMGGGSDVDAAFIWMINRSKGGDFLVLRTDDDPDYNPYIMGLSGNNLNSVTTICIFNRSASFDPKLVEIVGYSDAVFFAGGDQWTYYQNWKDTPLHIQLNNLIKKPIPIGGTSAGMISLGKFLFTAQFDSVYSSDTLSNPYLLGVTLGTNFISLPFLTDLITDVHFYQRDRMGRLITFLSRLLTDIWTPNQVKGVGTNEGTALAIDANGIASQFSWDTNGSSYLLLSTQPPLNCTPGNPLQFEQIQVVRIQGNVSMAFDFSKWQIVQNNSPNIIEYSITVKNGDLLSSNGNIY